MKKFDCKKFIILSVIILFLGGILYSFFKPEKQEVPYTKFLDKVETGQIGTVFLSNSEKIKFKEKNNLQWVYTDNPRTENFKEKLLENNIKVSEKAYFDSYFSNILGIFLIGAIFTVVYRKNGQKQKNFIPVQNFDNSVSGAVYFKDIAGNEEAKENAQDIIDFLTEPEKYEKMGIRVPKGIIFYGEPGTGKTIMAKAIASEAKVPFYSVCGSDFVEMYVGVGASRVRNLFKKAREHQKAVIFIDEIDAIGKKRSMSNSGGNEEKDQTLNALLSEMSGFSSDNKIIVIATTNRLELLDDALLRAGRFDRHIQVNLPDILGREKILNLYLKDKNLDNSINIQEIAKKTVYFSGAMLENLINEASIIAIKENTCKISSKHIDKAYLKIIAGDEKIDKGAINLKEREITAFHEAGHAILTKILSPETSISKISIIPTTKGAGGFCLNINKDKLFYSKKDIEGQIMINYGGRISEEITFGKDNITTGAYNDIEKATKLIVDYVSKYAMLEESGMLNQNIIVDKNQNLSEKYKEVSLNLYNKARNIIIDNKEHLNILANILIEKETIDECEINKILNKLSIA